MSDTTRPQMLKSSWAKMQKAMKKTGITDRNEAIKAVADGYMNAGDDMQDLHEVHRVHYIEVMAKHKKEVTAHKKEKRFLAQCLAVSLTVSFLLLGFLGKAEGWW